MTNIKETQIKHVEMADLGLAQESLLAPNNKNFSLCIRVLLQNWRQGTVACKGRGEI